MVMKQLREHLDSEGIKYVIISHSQAFTAQEIAASAHIPGKELAKTVIVKLDGQMAMVVLPASLKIDFDRLKETTRAESVELAGEREFAELFGECELGAMPPFGHLFDMPVYVDQQLTADEEIAFNAGSHTELIRMRYDDFARLAQPKVIDLSRRLAA